MHGTAVLKSDSVNLNTDAEEFARLADAGDLHALAARLAPSGQALADPAIAKVLKRAIEGSRSGERRAADRRTSCGQRLISERYGVLRTATIGAVSHG